MGFWIKWWLLLSLASRFHEVKAVIAQVPFVDGVEVSKHYLLAQLTKALKNSSQDYMGVKIGLLPKTLSIVDLEGFCFMPSISCYQGYLGILNPDYYWSGKVPARALVSLVRYRPIVDFEKIRVPVLFIAAKMMVLCRLSRVERLQQILHTMPLIMNRKCNILIFVMVNGLKKQL